MRSILGIIKDGAPANDMVYSSDFKAVSFKHFIILNLVFNIAKKEKINKIDFILINNFKKMSNNEVKSFLDKYDLIPVHFHGFKPLHIDSETTSCYISKEFNKKAKHIIPMAGTIREQHETDKTIL